MQHPDGTVTQTRYLPFGGYRDGSGGNPMTDRGYTGHKHNDDLGLIYMNARFYVPYINRFLSADTIVPEPTNPQALNRYSYVYNNPLRYTDPTGHLSEDEIEEYFGFTEKQEMIDAYGEAVTELIWGTPFTWGDVLEYDCASCYGGEGYAILLLLGNQFDEFRGAFWSLQAFHEGYDYRGIEVPKHYLKESADAHINWVWTEAYKMRFKFFHNAPIPINHQAYGISEDSMVSGTWHDFAFLRPAVFVGGFFTPGGVATWLSEGWGVIEEVTDDVLNVGHPLGDYHTSYPTIKMANQWGYLPTADTYSFLAPRSLFR